MKSSKLLILGILVMALALPVSAADISLKKDTAAGDIYHRGDTITYEMEIENVADDEQIRIDSVVDTLPDGTLVDLCGGSNPTCPFLLNPGDIQTYTLEYTVPLDTPCGEIVNYLTVSGVQLSTVPDAFTATVQKTVLILVPCIDVTKTVEPTTSKVGDEVVYTIEVCNCSGECMLHDLTLTSIDDTVLGDISGAFSGVLLQGDCETRTFTYTIQPGDDDSVLINEVTVIYEDITGYAVSDVDTAEVALVHPDFTVTKVCLNSPVPYGDDAAFEITITNTGDVDLIITTDEPAIPGPLPLPQGGPPIVQVVTRPVPSPGVEDVCNSITVTATLPPELGLDNEIVKDSGDCCLTQPPLPCIDITKTVDCDVSKVGDIVTYTICIMNCGPTTILFDGGDIIDSVLGDISEAFGFTCPGMPAPGVMPPGFECCLEFPYQIQPGDEPGPVVNTVTFTAVDEFGQVPDPAQASATVDLVHPELTVTKSCINENQQVSPGGIAMFEITVENTGDVCLYVTVDEAGCGPFTLDPLESETCSVNIDVPEDTTATEIINDVSATWTICDGGDCLTNTDTVGDDAICYVSGGATRTPGFWKTHYNYTAHILADNIPDCLGEPCIDLGWIEVCDMDEVCAVFWANNAKNSDGSKRSKLCQARMHASFHALAAIFNNCMPSGGGIPVSPAEIAAILGGDDIGAIKDLASILADYNESGDDIAIIDPWGPPGSATPSECKSVDMDFADCINGTASTSNQGRGKNK